MKKNKIQIVLLQVILFILVAVVVFVAAPTDNTAYAAAQTSSVGYGWSGAGGDGNGILYGPTITYSFTKTAYVDGGNKTVYYASNISKSISVTNTNTNGKYRVYIDITISKYDYSTNTFKQATNGYTSAEPLNENIIYHPSNAQRSMSYTFNYVAGGLYKIRCSVWGNYGTSYNKSYGAYETIDYVYISTTAPALSVEGYQQIDNNVYYANNMVTLRAANSYVRGIYLGENGATPSNITANAYYNVTPAANTTTTYTAYSKDNSMVTSATQTFIIDRIAPTLSITAGGINMAADGSGFGKGVVKAASSDDKKLWKVVVNGTAIALSGTSSSTTITDYLQQGVNTVVLHDYATNTATLTFTYDTVLPTISLYKNNVKQADLANTETHSNYLNGTVKIVVNDSNFNQMTVNGNVVGNNTEIAGAYLKQGKNTVVVNDKAGNSSTMYFNYDNVLPTATMTNADGTVVSWGNLCNQYVSFNTTDASSGIYSAIIKNLNNATETYDWINYTVGGTLYYYSVDGENTNVLFSLKSAAKEYVIEKRKETVVYYASGYNSSLDANLLSGEFAYATADCAYYSYTRKNGTTAYAIRVDTIYNEINTEYDNWIISFVSTKKLFEHEGEWQLTLIDNAGNEAVYYFNIDITNPEVVVKKGSAKMNNGAHYKQGDVLEISASDTNFSNIKLNGITGAVTGNSGTFTLNTATQSWLNYGKNTIYVFDTYGNETTFVFYYDNVVPELSSLKNDKPSNGYFKLNDKIKITISEDFVEFLKINDTIVKNSAGSIVFTLNAQEWLVEGVNTVLCADRAGNTTSFTFVFDKTAPTGTLTGVTNTGKTNTDVSFSWAEEGATATINSSNYTSGSTISAEGNYTIVLTDRAGNATTYTFEIYKTAPTGTLSGVANAGITNGSVSFSWTKNGVTATLNGNDYTKGTMISNEGEYSIVLTDDVGNTSIPYTFTIDKTAPEFTLSGVADAGITNGNVTLSWTEQTATLKVNGSTPVGIVNGATKSYVVTGTTNVTNNYTATLTDVAGNVSTYTFTIDKELPLIVMKKADGNEISWGQISNQFVTFTASDDGGVIVSVIITNTSTGTTFDWSSFSANNTTLYYYRPEGNATSNLFASQSKAKSYVLQQRLATVAEQPLHGYEGAAMDAQLHSSDNGYAVLGCDYYAYTNAAGNTLYFIRYSSLYDYIIGEYSSWTSSFVSNKVLFTEEGAFTISATDVAGNVTTQAFSIDTIAPTGTLSGATNNGITNGTVTFSWSESGCTATLDGNSYVKGADITAEGTHIIRLRDVVGNSTTYTFEIDKTAPTGTLTGVTNGGRTNGNVSLNWSEAGLAVTLDAAAYTKKTAVTANGFHTFELTDVAGNVTTYTFTIDTSVPEGTLTGVIEGGITNGNVAFSWAPENWTATLNGNSYTKGNAITDEAVHRIVLTNDVGTTRTYTFEIDKTPPTGTLTGVTNGGVTKTAVSFSWTGTNTCTDNGNSYTKNTSITAEGEHSLVLTDAAGNSTTYNFIIRTAAPVAHFSSAAFTIDGNNYYYNKDVSVSWEENDVTATINGVEYIKATLISAEGNYTIVLTDEPGNKTTVVVIIDKTPYTSNYNRFVQDYANHNNHWYETFVYTLSGNNYVRQSYWSFTNNTDAMTFATLREQSIVERYASFSIGTTPYCTWAGRAVDGFDAADQTSINGYPYAIYYDKDDSSKLIAYFNESNLQAAIIKYATASISEKYIPSTPAAAYIGDGTVPAQSLYRNYIFVKGSSASFVYKPSDITLTINGHAATYTSGLSLGVNNIKEVDRAGNVIEYIVILDNEVPVVIAKDFSGNTIPNIQSQFVSQTTIYAAEQFRMTLADEYDNQALMTIIYGDTTTNVINGSYDFTESGTYTVKIRDLAGNNKTYTLYLSLQQPNVVIEKNLSSQSVLIGFTATIDKVLDINTLMNISVFTWDAVAEEWVAVLADDNSSSVSVSTLSYYFATTNNYKITVLDSYGRETAITYNFVKDAPTGRVLTSTGLQLKEGAETQLSVKFVWDDSTSLAYLNELEYTKGVMITDEGKYTIKLVSTGGEMTFYNFKIDRTAPTGTLTGINANNYSNTSVTMTWSAETEASTVGYIKTASDVDYYPYAKGTVIVADNSYSIKLVDGAGNSRVYSFEIKKTPPLVKIMTASGAELKNAGLTNQTCYFTWSESGCTATIKNSITNEQVSYAKGTNIYTTATYSFYITDKYGNMAYYSITIDKIAPIITATGLSADGGYTKENVSFDWTESNVTVLLNGDAYVKNTVISAEGQYSLVGTDAAGNATTYTFTIDKTAPTGTLTGTGNLVGDVYYIRSAAQFTWKESGCTATLNGEPYAKTTQISGAGNYTLVLTDKVGNATTYNVIIDLEAPVASIQGNYNLVNNEYYFKTNTAIDWSDATATATLNGEAYEKLTNIETEGRYTVVLSDRAGNSTTYTIIIDKTAPTLSFSTSFNRFGETYYFKAGFSTSWSDNGCTTTLNDAAYAKNTAVTIEGDYTFVITDRAGNSTTYTIIIDKTAPEGSFTTNYLLKNGVYYFNGNTTFDCTEENVTLTLDGVTYVKTTLIEDEGSHLLVVTDRAGNNKEYEFVIDKTAPEGSFTTAGNVYDGIYYFRYSTAFTWSENSLTATLNGNSYTKGTTIAAEGAHTLKLLDKAENATEYSFVIDKTAPEIVVSVAGNEVGNISYYKTDISLVWTDVEVVAAVLNGKDYIMESVISEEGSYVFELTDRAGNTKTLNFVVDKTAPVGELAGTFYGPENYSNNNVRFAWTEDGCTATLNAEKYTKNAYINKQGNYTIVLTDRAGNSTTYTFIIMTTHPLGVLEGVTDGGKTAGTVKFTWSDLNYTCTLNGESYESGAEISMEGHHSIILTGPNAVSTTYTFEIDRTAPEGALSGVAENGRTNGAVTFSWSESGCTATLNGNSYTKGATIFAEGKYVIVLTDAVGNTTTYTFEIDKTAPTGTLTGVTNGGRTNTDVRFNWTENKCVADINGSSYTANAVITAEGEYSIVLTDDVGNSTTYTFTIDKTAPTGTLSGVTNGGVTNSNVNFTWSGTQNTVKLNGEAYTKGAAIINDGNYTITISDDVGNTTTYTFEIKKRAAIGTLNGVDNDGITNNDVAFYWYEEGATATLNGDAYVLGTTITAEGKHVIVLTDVAGNIVTYTFTIDKTAPEGTLSGVTPGGKTNTDVSFSWTETTNTATVNGNQYKKNDVLFNEGDYIIVLTDVAGNTTEYRFTIDKTAPLFGYTNVIVKTDNKINYFAGEVSLNWTEEGATATLNGEAYINGDAILDDGNYTFVISDDIGNSRTFVFVIDKTAPTGTLSGVTNGGRTKEDVIFVWNDGKATATLDGANYNSGTVIIKDGSHIIVLTDDVGNATTYTFEIDKTAPTGTLSGVTNGGATNGEVVFTYEQGPECNAYLFDEDVEEENEIILENSTSFTEVGTYVIIVSDTVGNTTTYTFEIDKTAPTGTLSGVNENNISNRSVSFSWSEIGCTATLNGVEYTKNTFVSLEGDYRIILTNRLGTTTEYLFTIDKTAPTGTLSGIDKQGYTKSSASFTWSEEGATATLNNEPYDKDSLVETEGSYTIVLTDVAGNSSTYTFEIDKTAPTATFSTEFEEKDGVYYFAGSTVITWKDKASAVCNDVEMTSNSYLPKDKDLIIVLTDRAGNSTEYKAYVYSSMPSISVAITSKDGTTKDVELQNGKTYTFTNMTIEPDENFTIYLNGVEIKEASTFTSGENTLKIVNKAGKESTITVNINEETVEEEKGKAVNIILIIIAVLLGLSFAIIVIKNSAKRGLQIKRI